MNTAQQDMRAEFESEIRKHGYGQLRIREDNGCYEYAPTEHAWQGWQTCKQHRQQELSAARLEIERLRGALEKYGRHISLVPNSCTALMGVFGGSQCSCGLNEALAAPKE